MNCWDYMRCEEDQRMKCPAYPVNGKNCWKVTGTLCDGEVQGSFVEKLSKCLACDFRKTVLKSQVAGSLPSG